MECYHIIFLLTIILTIFLYPKLFRRSKLVLPPGPKPWPIIGNIHQLGDKPHQAIAELSKKYGPIMSLKLGRKTTIVLSSPEVAKEMFLKHDLALSSRTVPRAAKAGDHDKFSMVWLPVCPKWRTLRKIATIRLFTTQQLDASQNLRHKKMKELVCYVRQCWETGLPVDVGKAGFTTTLNLLSNTFFSMDLASHASSSSQEFKELVWHMLKTSARPQVSDFLPLVKYLDLRRVVRRSKENSFTKLMGVFEGIIERRLRDPNAANEDVLGTLLKLVKDDHDLSLDDIKHLLFDLFVAGTDTTSATLEWAMTELLRDPKQMVKAQSEIDQLLGRDRRSIQESKLSKLPYIQAIVKETLRLHPPVPLLIPHKAEKNIELCGYLVPKNAQIWVNLWSIGRDTSAWLETMLFYPERFIEKGRDVNGRDFELIPFGAGRRMCPGMPLAYRMVHLMLVTLLQSFDWKIHDEVGSNDIDMEEEFGLTLQKAQPLRAIPVPR